MEHNACLSDLDINKSNHMEGGSFTSYASHCPAIPRNACLNIYNSIKEKKRKSWKHYGNEMFTLWIDSYSRQVGASVKTIENIKDGREH